MGPYMPSLQVTNCCLLFVVHGVSVLIPLHLYMVEGVLWHRCVWLPGELVFTDHVTAVRSDRMKCEVYRAALSAHIQTNAAKLELGGADGQMEPTVVVKKEKVTSEIVSLSKN